LIPGPWPVRYQSPSKKGTKVLNNWDRPHRISRANKLAFKKR
jgi:hypothetical protein